MLLHQLMIINNFNHKSIVLSDIYCSMSVGASLLSSISLTNFTIIDGEQTYIGQLDNNESVYHRIHFSIILDNNINEYSMEVEFEPGGSSGQGGYSNPYNNPAPWTANQTNNNYYPLTTNNLPLIYYDNNDIAHCAYDLGTFDFSIDYIGNNKYNVYITWNSTPLHKNLLEEGDITIDINQVIIGPSSYDTYILLDITNNTDENIYCMMGSFDNNVMFNNISIRSNNTFADIDMYIG